MVRFGRSGRFSAPTRPSRAPLRARRLRCESLESRRVLSSVSPFGSSFSDAEGEPDPQVVIRLQATDLAGRPISQTLSGSQVWLNVTVQDVRPNQAQPGVFAAYLDLLFAEDLLSVVPDSTNPLGFDIEFNPQFVNGRIGQRAGAGRLDEVGAFQSIAGALGGSEVWLFRTRMVAGGITVVDDHFAGVTEDSTDNLLDVLANDLVRSGSAAYRGDAADVTPGHDVIVYNPPSSVPDSQVRFVDGVLQVSGSGPGLITQVGTPDRGGLVRISSDGSRLLYTPATDFFGLETFTYSVANGSSGQVAVDVQPVNDRPVAVDDAYGVARNVTTTFDVGHGVLRNDHDVDGDPLIARRVSGPAHGVLDLRSDGSFDYTPDSDYRGPDQFVYEADDSLARDAATVSIDVGIPVVGIRLDVTDTAGQPVARLRDGDTFLVKAWVQDLRGQAHDPRGVEAAHLDVHFDPATVLPVINAQQPLGFEIDFGPDYIDPGEGSAATAGLIDEVGSHQAQIGPLGPDEVLLFDMKMNTTGPRAAEDAVAVSAGSQVNLIDVLANDRSLSWPADLISEAADVSPTGDVRLFQLPTAVDPLDIRFEGDSVVIENRADMFVASAGPAGHGTVTVAPDGQSVFYRPEPLFAGSDEFTYTAMTGVGGSVTTRVQVDVVRSWQNLRDPLDVNSDGQVQPLDALLVVNELNANGSHALGPPPDGPPYYDVHGDGIVMPLDALLVINYLNDPGGGEGEQRTQHVVSNAGRAEQDGMPRMGGSVFAIPFNLFSRPSDGRFASDLQVHPTDRRAEDAWAGADRVRVGFDPAGDRWWWSDRHGEVSGHPADTDRADTDRADLF